MEDTFILPAEENFLKEEMQGNPNNFWIVKPPDMSCGQGIQIINDIRKVPETKVKSRYNCYMLLGYDILIDANLQPHLIGES